MSAIAPGARFGPYEIVALLGAGGMGEVWRGRDTRLDRNVAIKILSAAFAQNSELKLRFEREARAISQLNHPNICTLYDVGDSFLVMELLEGESLAERLARGPLPMTETIRYGVQIAEALDRAHRAGIVHRDLKPGNVMITKSGAKLLDFGLAKSSVAVVSGDGATVQKPLTEEGTILGTFQYMAPEQLEGEEADARTDIFALGTLLYEMATGKRAFDGKTKTSLIAAIVTAQPPPIALVQPLTPPAFEHVVQKCLAKDRDSRWQSAHDIAEELRWIGEAGLQAGVAAPVTLRRKSRERIAWGGAVVLAIAATLFAARASHLFQTRPAEYRLTIPAFEGDYRLATAGVVSQDGRTIYFNAITPENKRLMFRRQLDDFRALPIEGTEGTIPFVAITPDGRSLLVGFGGGVFKRISVDGGPLEPVGVVEAAQGAAVAPDGSILVGSGNLNLPIRRMLPNGTVEEALTLDKAHGEVGQTWPVLLPQKKRFGIFRQPPRFLFLSVSREPARGVIHFTLCAASLESKEVKRIAEVPSGVEYADGQLFYIREGTLMAQPFDAEGLALTGEAIPVATEVNFSSRTGAANFSVSHGTISCGRAVSAHHLTWVDSTGKKLGIVGNAFSLTLTGVGGPPRLPISPQGDRVVIGINDHRMGTSSLWVEGLTRETSNQVTFGPAAESHPVLSPDGSRVFFASDAQSGWDIFEAPLDGSEPPRLLVSADNLQVPSDVSPDGGFLLYTSNQTQTATKQDLWILPLSGDRKAYPFLATPAVENGGVFSHDGKWIAYSSDATGAFQVYVRPFPGPGAARPVSTKGGSMARFSTDGKRLYFVSGSKMMGADFRDGTVGEPKMLFELSERISTYQPAGDRFLMALVNDIDASPPTRVIVNWSPTPSP